MLRWLIQRGVIVACKSTHIERMQENINVFDFELTDEEMKQIETINKHEPFYHVTEESLHRMATTKCNFE